MVNKCLNKIYYYQHLNEFKEFFALTHIIKDNKPLYDCCQLSFISAFNRRIVQPKGNVRYVGLNV